MPFVSLALLQYDVTNGKVGVCKAHTIQMQFPVFFCSLPLHKECATNDNSCVCAPFAVNRIGTAACSASLSILMCTCMHVSVCVKGRE